MNTEQTPETVDAADRRARAVVLRALGDPIRLGVVDLLQAQDLSPDQLADALEVPGNLLAHHLKVLQSAGVITRTDSQNDRRRTYVRLVAPALDGLLPVPAAIDAPRVVFVCTHNSARSVLAEAAWREVSDVPSASAGTRPADRINPRAVATAQQAGLVLDDVGPRSVVDVLRPDDVVVSVCDAVNEELGPVANPHFHWSIADPSRQDTDAAFTDALTDIRHRVAELAPRIRFRRSTVTRRRT